MEDKKKEFLSQEPSEKEKSKLERFKSFAYRHRRTIIFGVGSLVIIGGTAFFFKRNPEYGEELMYKLRVLIDEGDSEIIEVEDLSDSELENLIEEPTKVIAEPVDLVETYSARRLGGMIGESAQWVNKKHSELEYLEGEPGGWTLTEKGKAISVQNAYDNGVGGYYHICNPYYEWKKDIICELGNPDAYQDKVNAVQAEIGLPLMEKVA